MKIKNKNKKQIKEERKEEEQIGGWSYSILKRNLQ